ncbi:hypothetical protein [Pseudomonas sp. HS6]|uniref:hypothetical protein n=1 Tax=Pseudomonas sp. HS6 TaxID=2850559 RepID=UPI002019BA1C|nr:hypothetical protein [Pseudomonas sp. HS6]UQS16594.1 hypothetical protein JJN09_06945 [Pseudomonas sp. HS6]
MFSHESVPLIILFIILLLGVLTAVLHPVHAFFSWLQRRRQGSSTKVVKEVDAR